MLRLQGGSILAGLVNKRTSRTRRISRAIVSDNDIVSQRIRIQGANSAVDLADEPRGGAPMRLNLNHSRVKSPLFTLANCQFREPPLTWPRKLLLLYVMTLIDKNGTKCDTRKQRDGSKWESGGFFSGCCEINIV